MCRLFFSAMAQAGTALAGFALTAIALTGVVGFAQSTQIYEELQVQVHQLHVNVVDRQGEPIKGLATEDFTVKLNGKVQDILSVVPISLAAESEIQEGGSSADLPELGRRLYLFLFDTQNTKPISLDQARSDVMRFVLEDMLPSDMGSVFLINELGLTMVSNFTGDKSQLLHAVKTFGFTDGETPINKAGGFVVAGNLRNQEGVSARQAFATLRKSVIQDGEYIGLAVGGGKYDNPVLYIRSGMKDPQREGLKGLAISYFHQFEELAKYLRVLRGRKNLILFSEGVDGDLVMGESWSPDSEAFAAGNIISGLRRLVEMLQGSGTVVFTVDTSREVGTSRQKSSLHTLNDISSSTGGRVFANTDDYVSTLREIRTITSDYYLVNIHVNLDTDAGELARVNVKVDRPRTKVYTSKGLLVNPDYGSMGDVERKLMLSDYVSRDLTAQAIPMAIKVFPMPLGEGRIRLNVMLDMAGDYFLHAGSPMQPRPFDVTMAAVEKNTGILMDQQYRTFQLAPQRVAEVLGKTGIKYFGNLFVPPGEYKIKVVVRDLVNGKTTSSIQELMVADERPAVFGPLFVTNHTWLILRGEELPSEEGLKTQAAYPFAFGATRLVPSHQEFLAPGETARFLFLLEKGSLQEGAAVAVVVVDEAEQFQVATPEALSSQAYSSEVGAGLLVNLDTAGMNLVPGKGYRLLTRISLSGRDPLVAEHAFAIPVE